MSAFFNAEDFYTTGDLDTMNTPLKAAENANKKLSAIAISGFSQKHRGEWSFTERPMKGDTHNALLLNLGAIEPCAHETFKVKTDVRYLYRYICQCGADVVPSSFVEKKK